MNYSQILKVDLEKSSRIVFLQFAALIYIIRMLIVIFNKSTALKHKTSLFHTNLLLHVFASLIDTIGAFATSTQRSIVNSINSSHRI